MVQLSPRGEIVSNLMTSEKLYADGTSLRIGEGCSNSCATNSSFHRVSRSINRVYRDL